MKTIKTDELKAPPKALRTSASYSITLRLKIKNTAGMLGQITSKIGEMGGDIGAVDIAGLKKNVSSATSQSM